MRYCSKCGAEIKSGTNFCAKCGKEVVKVKTEGSRKAERVKVENVKFETLQLYGCWRMWEMGLLQNLAGMLGETVRILKTARNEVNMSPAERGKLNELIKMAEEGNIEMMLGLGNTYWEGRPVRYDLDEACKMLDESGWVWSYRYNV